MNVGELTVKIQEWMALYGIGVLGALAILVLGWIAAGMATRLVVRVMRRAELDETVVGFGRRLAGFLFKMVVLIAALNQLGFSTTSLVAVLGAMGLAVGLALQSNLASLAAGVLLVVFRPFKVGDMVEASGVLGKVESVALLTTIVVTPDNRTVIIPNNKVLSDKIINLSLKEIRRIDLAVGVGYDDDLDQAKQAVGEALAADSRVLRDPAPAVYVVNLGDSSVDLTARAWVKTADYWDARCDLTEAVKKRLDQEGVNIP
jgi:small conductance mechanosensitive channel